MSSSEMQLFVSFAKKASQGIAEKFCELVESLPLGVKCWCAARIADLPQGPEDHRRIREAASTSFACVSIVTPDNLEAPWLYFEAGLFYGAGKKVFGLLTCGVRHQELKKRNSPFEGYHAYLEDKASVLNLIKSLNSDVHNVDEKRLSGFDLAFTGIDETHRDIARSFRSREGQQEAMLVQGVAKVISELSRPSPSP